MNVLFVDDDKQYLTIHHKLLTRALKPQSTNVVSLTLADDALDYLRGNKEKDTALAIVDVMLSARPESILFAANETQHGKITGIRLIEKILEENLLDPRRLIIFTYITEPKIIKQIQDLAARHSIPYIPKSAYMHDAPLFAKYIIDYLASLALGAAQK